MTVVPFPSTRFTRLDVAAIVELCYRLTTVGSAGGWARHTSDSGADVLRILDPRDDSALFTFDRSKDGRYRVWDELGGLMVEEGDVETMLARWHKVSRLPLPPMPPANRNRRKATR